MKPDEIHQIFLVDVLICFLVLWWNADQKPPGEKKVYFRVGFYSPSLGEARAGTQGIEAEVWKSIAAFLISERSFLASFPCIMHSDFSYTAQPYLPRGGGLGPPSSISNEEKHLTDVARGHFHLDSPSVKIPSSFQVTLGWGQVDRWS